MIMTQDELASIRLKYSIVNNIVLLPLAANPDVHRLHQLRDMIASNLQKSHPRAVIINAHDVQFLSPDEYRAVRGIMDTCKISGVRAFLVGIQAAVATTLALSDDALDVRNVMLDVDAAMHAIESENESEIDSYYSN